MLPGKGEARSPAAFIWNNSKKIHNFRKNSKPAY